MKTDRSHRRTTTLMTNDSVVADAFRPYRSARYDKHIFFLLEVDTPEEIKSILDNSVRCW